MKIDKDEVKQTPEKITENELFLLWEDLMLLAAGLFEHAGETFGEPDLTEISKEIYERHPKKNNPVLSEKEENGTE